MNKFTFKMKDRMKLVVERPATNSCTVTVSGKTDTTFRFSKKRAAELVDSLKWSSIGIDSSFSFKKTLKAPSGRISLQECVYKKGFYELSVEEKGVLIFCEGSLSKKWVKKLINTMKEVYGVE